MTNDYPAPMSAESLRGVESRFTGAIIGLHDDVLQGWAADVTDPQATLVIEVFIDGASVALVRADQYEPIADAPHEFCGFTVQLRRDWLNTSSTISVGIANSNMTLPGCIKLPACTISGMTAVASQLWHTGGLRIAGWSWDPREPTRHVTLRVKDGDRLVLEVVCNERHQALSYRETCDHGFTIDLPWELADGNVHVLTVEDDKGQSVAGSPIHICCVPEGMESVIGSLETETAPAKFALLKVLARDASIRLPKSVGLQHYSEWFEAFQRPGETKRPPLVNRVGIVVLTNDGTTADELRETLQSIGETPHELLHILYTDLDNASLGLSEILKQNCDSILPILAGDRLGSDAIYHMAKLLDGGCKWGYVDCDQDGPSGERTNPWLKPTWDLDTFIGADIFTPGAIFDASLVKEALELLTATKHSHSYNWYELLAAIALLTHRNSLVVAHLPLVLFHRSHNSTLRPENSHKNNERKLSIAWLCGCIKVGAVVEELHSDSSLLRVNWPLPEKLPRVSLIVPTRDQYKLLSACVEGILNRTDYANLELIVVDNESTEPQTLRYFEELRSRGVVILSHPYPFNYSAINNSAVNIASGEIIGLINNDIEVLESGWLKEMVAQLLRDGVGAVGAKLLWPNLMVQHAGVVVGINGLAAHTGNALEANDPGFMNINLVCREQSAVTAACLLLRKNLFEGLGGLDESCFPVAFNDVDMCLRIQKSGQRILWTPFAKLIHAESASRGKDEVPEKKSRALREQQNFLRKWCGFVDPFYNPSLSLDFVTGPFGGLALPPACQNIRYSCRKDPAQ